MNFLAHTLLSDDHLDIIMGNLIGDMVKGNGYNKFDDNVSLGLQLHRKIDNFTDHHSAFMQTRDLIKPYFHRYSGVVTDIYYDHFLSLDWSDYHPLDLQKFVNAIYIHLIKRYRVLPPRGQRVVPLMILRNWLGTYGSMRHLHQIFLGMHYRTKELGNMNNATEVLQKHYDEIQQHFRVFMPELVEYSSQELGLMRG